MRNKNQYKNLHPVSSLVKLNIETGHRLRRKPNFYLVFSIFVPFIFSYEFSSFNFLCITTLSNKQTLLWIRKDEPCADKIVINLKQVLYTKKKTYFDLFHYL